MIFFALIELVLSVSLSESLIQRKFKKIVLSISVLVLLPTMIWLVSSVGQVFEYPEIEDSYLIELPTQGAWMAGHAGGSVLTNYHNAIASQKYAIDVVKVNEDGWFFQNSGEELTDIYSFGEPIYAPVAGVVTTVVDSLPDHEISFSPSDSLNPAGNHVVIHFDKDRYLFMAHLMAGTIEVQKGDSVLAGDIIGKIGNSGNTSWPHLHMHIQNKPAIRMADTQAYPFRFKEMERKRWFFWQMTENDFLLRNDFFRE
ncbi:M23 family metallopeptidase [Gracilimonas halophila]|uniref:M23 family metallopeptidase n=1 Tax=Gracilimonas halophila TaxID=1834464 RepID=A0ABW5JDW6_9BACT